MNLNLNTFAIEISNILAAAVENYTTTVVDLGEYGDSCEITKHGSDRKLYLTPVEDGLIDMVLYAGTGNTIANGTLFDKAGADITPETLAKLVAICL